MVDRNKRGPNGLRHVLPDQKAAPYQPYVESPIQSDTSAFNNGKSYTLAGGRVNPSQVIQAQPMAPIVNPGVSDSLAGGLGNYASYNIPGSNEFVGMDKAAYDATTANGNIAGLTQNNPGVGLAGMLQNKDLMTGISGGMSALGTGFDIYDKMWGDTAKSKRAQVDNQKSQTAYNNNALEHKKAFRAGLASSGISGGA